MNTMLVTIDTPPASPVPVAVETEVKKRKYRFKSGTVALRVIKKLQTTTDLLVQKGPFRKLVKQITAKMGVKILYQKKAIQALQDATEGFIVEKFKHINKHTKHAKHKTICVSNMQILA